MVTWTDNDPRETYIANSGIRAVNAARKHANTYGNPNWALSQPTSFYLDKNNLSKIKPTLAAMKGNQNFYTTDQNESRNMYQMLMNAIKGGGGAQMIDTSNLPTGARRYGRTLFQDPAKRQGFIGDLMTMATMGKNPAAVRAPLINYFPQFGQAGKDFYAKEFPWSNAFSGIMNTATNFIPGSTALKAMLPKKKRKVIPRTLLNATEGIVPLLKPYRPIEDESINDGLNIFDIYLENSQIPPQFNIQKLRDEGREGKFNLEDNIPSAIEEDITNDIVIKQKPPFPEDDTFDVELDGDALVEESFNKQYSFINENPDLTPYEWVMTMMDETGGTMDEIIQNGILQGIIIEN